MDDQQEVDLEEVNVPLSDEKLDLDSEEHIDIQLAFLKILPSFPPIGKHKHFRAIALQHNVQEATQRDVAMSVIWQTLQDLYDVEELGNLHEADQESLPESPRELSPLPRTPPPENDLGCSDSENENEPDASKSDDGHASDDSLTPPPPSSRMPAKNTSKAGGAISPPMTTTAEPTPRGRQTRGGPANRRGRTRSASSTGSRSHNAGRRARQLSIRPSAAAAAAQPAAAENSLMHKYPDYPYFAVYPHHPAFRAILALELNAQEAAAGVDEDEEDAMTVLPESMIQNPLVYVVVQAEQEQQEEGGGEGYATNIGFRSRSAAIIDSAHFELEFALPSLPMPGASNEDKREALEWMRLIEERGMRKQGAEVSQEDENMEEQVEETVLETENGGATNLKDRRSSISRPGGDLAQSEPKASSEGSNAAVKAQASTSNARQIKRSVPLSGGPLGPSATASSRSALPKAAEETAEDVDDDDEDPLALHPNEHFVDSVAEEHRAAKSEGEEANARGRSPTTTKKANVRKTGSGSRTRGRGQSRSTSSTRPAKRERERGQAQEGGEPEEDGGRAKRPRRR